MPPKRKVGLLFSAFYPLELDDGTGVAVWYGGHIEVDEDAAETGQYDIPPPSQSRLDAVRERYRHEQPPQWKVDHYNRIKDLPRRFSPAAADRSPRSHLNPG